jgi:hypothetical protein
VSAPAHVDVDRITISIAGIDPDLARRLGAAVAQRLAPSLSLAAGGALLDHVRVDLEQVRGESMDALAGRIASQVASAVGRETPAAEAGR